MLGTVLLNCFAQFAFTARTYTLMLAKRDAQLSGLGANYIYPYPQNVQSSDGSVFLHWLRINVPGQDLNGGTEVLPYYGKGLCKAGLEAGGNEIVYE